MLRLDFRYAGLNEIFITPRSSVMPYAWTLSSCIFHVDISQATERMPDCIFVEILWGKFWVQKAELKSARYAGTAEMEGW